MAFCRQCGTEIPNEAQICYKCNAPTNIVTATPKKKKGVIVAILLGIVLLCVAVAAVAIPHFTRVRVQRIGGFEAYGMVGNTWVYYTEEIDTFTIKLSPSGLTSEHIAVESSDEAIVSIDDVTFTNDGDKTLLTITCHALDEGTSRITVKPVHPSDSDVESSSAEITVLGYPIVGQLNEVLFSGRPKRNYLNTPEKQYAFNAARVTFESYLTDFDYYSVEANEYGFVIKLAINKVGYELLYYKNLIAEGSSKDWLSFRSNMLAIYQGFANFIYSEGWFYDLDTVPITLLFINDTNPDYHYLAIQDYEIVYDAVMEE